MQTETTVAAIMVRTLARAIPPRRIPRAPHAYLDRPRIQFNWGYWDAIALTSKGAARPDGLTAETILDRHPDPFYANGYVMGAAVVRGQGPRGTSSEPAWQDFRAGLTDPNLIFRIEANP
jgi:hypothetical protein